MQVEVHLKFRMVPETLYLAINIMDRYLQFKQVRRSRLQLVGVATLLVSISLTHFKLILSYQLLISLLMYII